MKAAPVIEACAQKGFKQFLVHTGQHYDAQMSEVFFEQLGLPKPDINLEVGSNSHAAQTAEIMTRFEKVALERKPDMVLVYGDVNSTVAAALVCAKLLIPVAHVEAGLRSFDRTMPEEVNRIVTDRISDLLFTPSSDADENLKKEGISASKIHLVGNVMIDTLVKLLPLADKKDLDFKVPQKYALVTLHRPSNVDDEKIFSQIIKTLAAVSQKIPVIFPVHPRTRQRMEKLLSNNPALQIVEPLGYLEFLKLQKGATVVVTDSGGIQEETTFLNVPCLTLRENTERPVTVDMGTNQLIGFAYERLQREVDNILAGKVKKGRIPPLWDGKAAQRIVNYL